LGLADTYCFVPYMYIFLSMQLRFCSGKQRRKTTDAAPATFFVAF
jgi:hypothetical protein